MNAKDCSLEQFLTTKITGNVSSISGQLMQEFGATPSMLPEMEIIQIEPEKVFETGELASIVAEYFLRCEYDVDVKYLKTGRTNDAKLEQLLSQRTGVPNTEQILTHSYMIQARRDATNTMIFIGHNDTFATVNKYCPN